MEKAKELIHIAKEAGANAAKFQHFKADTIVSDYGFKSLNSKISHQKKWDKSVYKTYQNSEVPLRWTQDLFETCQKLDIDFFTSPYDINQIDIINPFVSAYKLGSGDITYYDIIKKMALFDKPMLIATGASDLNDVLSTMDFLSKYNQQIVLMQCNTNYTAEFENFKHINLNVLKSYGLFFPNAILGLSDHTFGCATVLGAVALGARVVEKHLTDNNNLKGPDHKFSMNPKTWREMIDRTRELELALGDGIKKIENNEKETYILQRRCLRATKDLKAGTCIDGNSFTPLRPAPLGSVLPNQLQPQVLGNKKLVRNLKKGQPLQWRDISD